MPELPDVEYYRKKSRKALNKRITDVKVIEKKIVKNSEKALKKHLKDKVFTDSERIGKNIFLKAGNEYLGFHFGMTGDLYVGKREPKYTAFKVDFKDMSLSIVSRRKLGNVELVKDKPKELGKDAKSITEKEFSDLLKKSRGAVKTTLMKQENIAGLGNIYTDEILYHAGIHPKSKNLKEKEIKNLYKSMKNVLKESIKANADPEKMPKNYLISIREKDEDCRICSGKIEKIKVNGRGTYFCSKHQVK